MISRKLMESTREIPETAASPQEETITVSATPMVTARSCSMMRGTIKLRRALLENTVSPQFSLYNGIYKESLLFF